jgi:hypothetical protein
MRDRPLQRAETRAALHVRAMKIDGRLASDTHDKHIADYGRRSRALETRKPIHANEQTASRVSQDRHE